MDHTIKLGDLFGLLQSYLIPIFIVSSTIACLIFRKKMKRKWFEYAISYPINAAIISITVLLNNWRFGGVDNEKDAKGLAICIVLSFLASPIGVFFSGIVGVVVVGSIMVEWLANMIHPLL